MQLFDIYLLNSFIAVWFFGDISKDGQWNDDEFLDVWDELCEMKILLLLLLLSKSVQLWKILNIEDTKVLKIKVV